MPIRTIGDLFHDQLRDVFSVERQLIPAFEELKELADYDSLWWSLNDHIEATRRQLERLSTIGSRSDVRLDGDPSRAMEGLIKGGRSHLQEASPGPTRDFLSIAHTRRIQHYQIAAYAVLLSLANKLEREQEKGLLEESLKEESAFDATLVTIATDRIISRIPAD